MLWLELYSELSPDGGLEQRTKQMEQILNFQVLTEGQELVILIYTQY